MITQFLITVDHAKHMVTLAIQQAGEVRLNVELSTVEDCLITLLEAVRENNARHPELNEQGDLYSPPWDL